MCGRRSSPCSRSQSTGARRLKVAGLLSLPDHAATAVPVAREQPQQAQAGPVRVFERDLPVALPFLVAAGNGVALIQERLARQLAPAVPIRILPCPFDVEALWWHPMYERDAGHRWLRQLFTEAARFVHLGTDKESPLEGVLGGGGGVGATGGGAPDQDAGFGLFQPPALGLLAGMMVPA